MNITTNTYTSVYPTARIAVKKNVQKCTNGKVYLEDGTEFEIELFNPRQSSVLAKISINGTSISNSGLVIKPGQRVFLDRFIDVAKKFKFDTYEVSGTDSAVKEAIAKNGIVTVTFYDEAVPYVPFYYGSNYGSNQVWYGTSSPFIGTTTTNGTNTSSYFTNTSSFASTEEFNCCDNSAPLKKSLETGRVEQGVHSDTRFGTSNDSFNSYALTSVTVQILPRSVKPAEVKDIAIYCHGCGRKNKKNENFCPSCGTRIK